MKSTIAPKVNLKPIARCISADLLPGGSRNAYWFVKRIEHAQRYVLDSPEAEKILTE